MTRIGTLWGDVSWQRQSKVIHSVAALNDFEFDLPKWSFVNKPADHAARFPYGKIPAFEDLDGFKLIEGSTIARYLCTIGSVSLLGSTPQEVATVDQWVHFAEHEIGAPAGNIMGTIYGYLNDFNREILDTNQARLVRALNYVESHLATRPSGYVALDSLTLADFVLAGTVYTSATLALGTTERTRYPNVFAHYDKVTADDKVKAYWGTEKFVDARVTEAQAYMWD